MKKSSGPLVGFGGLAYGYPPQWDPRRPKSVFLQCEVETLRPPSVGNTPATVFLYWEKNIAVPSSAPLSKVHGDWPPQYPKGVLWGCKSKFLKTTSFSSLAEKRHGSDISPTESNRCRLAPKMPATAPRRYYSKFMKTASFPRLAE